MGLRIIAGELGGRRIEAPRGRRTRPTPERVREAWFSALGEAVRDARVVDLFAGSGALGIEALSRGAGHAHFVESDRRALEVLRRNLAGLGLEGRSTVVVGDAERFVGSQRMPFDIALADPPYDSTAGRRLVTALRKGAYASELWLEHAPSDELATGAFWTRRYGDTQVSAFRAAAEEDAPGTGRGEPGTA